LSYNAVVRYESASAQNIAISIFLMGPFQFTTYGLYFSEFTVLLQEKKIQDT